MLTECDERSVHQVDDLVAELSTALCRATHEDLPRVIQQGLDRIVDTIGVDRTTLVEYDDAGRIPKTFCATAPDSALSARSDDSVGASWLVHEWMPKTDTLLFARIPEDLPEDALTPMLREQLQSSG